MPVLKQILARVKKYDGLAKGMSFAMAIGADKNLIDGSAFTVIDGGVISSKDQGHRFNAGLSGKLVSNYISINAVNTGFSVTVCLDQDTSLSGGPVLSFGSSGSSDSFELFCPTHSTMSIASGTGITGSEPSFSFDPLDVITVSVISSTVYCYVNGDEVLNHSLTGSVPSQNATASLHIGSYSTGSATRYGGAIRYAYAHNYGLSASVASVIAQDDLGLITTTVRRRVAQPPGSWLTRSSNTFIGVGFA